MRMFGYYALHTFINQLKKLCRTWVLILLLVCLVGGGIIGAGVAILTDTEIDVYPVQDEDGLDTGLFYDDDGFYYYQVRDAEDNHILLDTDQYGMNVKWCIVSTSSHYGTMNNTGRECDDDNNISPSGGNNPQTLTDQAGTTFTQLTEEELTEIGHPENAGDDTELLRSTLYRDKDQITYVLLEDDYGMFYVLPYISYCVLGDAYDGLLDYDREYLLYCQVYPDYDPYYLQDYESETAETETAGAGTGITEAENRTAEAESTEDGISEINPEDLTEDISRWNNLAAETDPDAVFIDQGGNVFFLPTGQVISISSEGMVECIAFLVILILLIYYILSADKNGGRIFLMADVNVLFASPLKPQSVLLFRLMMKLAVILIWVFYFGLLYSPQLIDMGCTIGGEILMLLTIALMIGYALVLQVLLYTISATNPRHGKEVNIILALLGFAFLARYTVYWKNTGMAPLPALLSFLCSHRLRNIPVIGWGKAAAAMSFSGNFAAAVFWIGLLVIGLTGLVVITWHVKADFYEDAMAKSEEIAELQMKARERGNLFAFNNKKQLRKAEEREEQEEWEAIDASGSRSFESESAGSEARGGKIAGSEVSGGKIAENEARNEEIAGSEVSSGEFAVRNTREKKTYRGKRRRPWSGFLTRLTSDGLGHGWGSSVYFWKALHVRFRFGTFAFFTKTTVTYLALALVISLFGGLVLEENLFLAGVLTIGVFAFYRCLGNALKEDIDLDMFRMIPGSIWGRLFFSLMGMLANSLLDLIPAYLVMTLAFHESLSSAIGFIVLTLSLQLYAITVGAFMDVSIPISAGTAIKQIVQVMFIYFGLLPDAGILAWGMVSDVLPLAAVISFLVNLALTMLFLTLTASILDPKEGSLYSLAGGSCRSVRKLFSRLGWGMLILYGAASAAQVAASYLVVLSGADAADPAISYAITFLPEYLIGFPAGIWFLWKMPVTHCNGTALTDKNPSITDMIRLFFIVIFFGYTGYGIASLVNRLLIAIFGSGTVNVVSGYVTEGTTLLQFLFLCILAPCLEEFFFRKIIIDRIRRFGEINAVIFSAVVFGLFHGNLTQFIYAAAIGLILAYVYLRTEKLRFSIGLHMAFNFMGSIVAGKVSELVNASLEALGCPDAGPFDIIRMLFRYLGGMLTTAGGGTGELTGPVIGGLAVYLIYLIAIVLMWLAGLILFLKCAKEIHFCRAEEQLPSGRTFTTTWLNPGMIIFTILMGLMMIAVIALSVISLSV